MTVDEPGISALKAGWKWVPTLYFAEGLPYAAVMTIAVVMYKCLNVDNAMIAFATSWLYLPWVVKALWSPFVDLASTRRNWILTMEVAIAVTFALIASSLFSTVYYFSLSMAAFWLLAFLSATNDIASDGFYMLALDESQQSWWVGLRSGFYRCALVFGQGAIVYFAGTLESEVGVGESWQIAFALMAAIFAMIAIWHYFVLPFPASDHLAERRSPREIMVEFCETFSEFFRKRNVWLAIGFIFLYRLPEAQLVKLISPFMLDSREVGGLGLSTATVGVAYGMVGIGALLLGGIIGGFIVARSGLAKWLVPMALSMSLSCVTFLYLSLFPDSPIRVVYACVLLEQFGYGFGLTAFTLYLLNFSDGPRRTANYAICTGFMSLGMMLPGMFAGVMQQYLGYVGFFCWTMVCCVATLAVAVLVKKHL